MSLWTVYEWRRSGAPAVAVMNLTPCRLAAELEESLVPRLCSGLAERWRRRRRAAHRHVDPRPLYSWRLFGLLEEGRPRWVDNRPTGPNMTSLTATGRATAFEYLLARGDCAAEVPSHLVVVRSMAATAARVGMCCSIVMWCNGGGCRSRSRSVSFGTRRSSSVVEQGTHKPAHLTAVLSRVGTDRESVRLWTLSAGSSRAHNSDRART